MSNNNINDSMTKWCEGFTKYCRQQREIYSSYYNSTILRIENILILPNLGIIGYVFQGLPNSMGILNFILVLLVSAAPLISTCIAYFRAIKHYKLILIGLNSQLKSLQNKSPLSYDFANSSYKAVINIVSDNTRKLIIIERWVCFTYLAILISFGIIILLKFNQLSLIIGVSGFLFFVYIIIFAVYIYYINK